MEPGAAEALGWIEPLKQSIGAVIGLLVIWLGYRLIDRWASKFYEAFSRQADSMAKLAASMGQAHTDTRETLIVMRALAQTVDDTQREVSEMRRAGGAQLSALTAAVSRIEKEAHNHGDRDGA